MSHSIEMLEIVALGLKNVNHEVVYVGGTVCSLYATSPAPPEPRVTRDVDCVTSITSRREYSELEDQLRTNGFAHDTTADAPICRWVYRGILVDMMPTDPGILGFASRWAAKGLNDTVTLQLPGGVNVRLLSAPYYLASKLEAYISRGATDIRMSSDFEDVVTLLDNRSEIVEEVRASDDDLVQYVRASMQGLLANPFLREAVESSLGFGVEGERAPKVLSMIQILAHGKSRVQTMPES